MTLMSSSIIKISFFRWYYWMILMMVSLTFQELLVLMILRTIALDSCNALSPQIINWLLNCFYSLLNFPHCVDESKKKKKIIQSHLYHWHDTCVHPQHWKEVNKIYHHLSSQLAFTPCIVVQLEILLINWNFI